eukprot:TRINITY_DN19161_c0_g1_i13.p1 TRINITY_DN19161_c0_g1~~TRINITY_DN19161_c0_g1_i13.p1  ORF type:complete len:257 (-),score=-10.23 TRINITY_DN19161_c0_g1_i13:261-1031(-)
MIVSRGCVISDNQQQQQVLAQINLLTCIIQGNSILEQCSLQNKNKQQSGNLKAFKLTMFSLKNNLKNQVINLCKLVNLRVLYDAILYHNNVLNLILQFLTKFADRGQSTSFLDYKIYPIEQLSSQLYKFIQNIPAQKYPCHYKNFWCIMNTNNSLQLKIQNLHFKFLLIIIFLRNKSTCEIQHKNKQTLKQNLIKNKQTKITNAKTLSCDKPGTKIYIQQMLHLNTYNKKENSKKVCVYPQLILPNLQYSVTESKT